MTSMVKVCGKQITKPQVFQETERFVDVLAAVREAAATEREATSDLLAKIDGAMALVAADGAKFKKAAEPGKIVSVGTYLALLLDAYPNSGSQNAETFGGFLVDDVMELEPPIAAVEIACRRWRQRSKFPPAISEFLVEVKAAKARIVNAQEFITRLPEIRGRIARDIGR